MVTLTHWLVVQEKINQTKQPRVNWKQYLGNSLTQEIKKLILQNFTTDEIITILYHKCMVKMQELGYFNSTIDYHKLIKISVCARMVECNIWYLGFPQEMKVGDFPQET